MTCLLVATKIENSVTELRPCEAFFNEQELQQFHLALEYEPDLIKYVFYDFLVICPDSILLNYIKYYYKFRISRKDFRTASSWNQDIKPSFKFELLDPNYKNAFSSKEASEETSLNEEKKLETWLNYCHSQLQALYLLSHTINVQFYNTPSIICLAIWKFYFGELKNMPDTDEFMLSLLDPEVSYKQGLQYQIDLAVNSVVSELACLCNVLLESSAEIKAPSIMIMMKIVKKLGKLSSRSKRLLESETSN